MPSWMKKLAEVLKTKWFVWTVFGIVFAIMVAIFIHAWLGYAPTTGPDHTNPWSK